MFAMPEQLLIDNCAPTLAGLKTGNIVSVECPDREAFLSDVREMNLFFAGKGLRAVPVGYTKTRALLYIYRPSFLQRDLSAAQARAILEGLGYPAGSDACVSVLTKRIREEKSFPHEIGLFLGYPPSDVDAFMHPGNRKPLCIGFWKVYSDEAGARKTFGRFEKCQRIYREQWRKGRSIDKLTVAI